MVSDNDTFPKVVVLRSASASEHLKHILRRELDPTTLFGVVNLSTFDDDRMRRQINTPSKSRGTNEDLNGAIGEQVGIPDVSSLHEYFPRCQVQSDKLRNGFLFDRRVP